MQSSVASAALAAAFFLTPVAAGIAPAYAQDFSITNQIEPADAGRRDLMRQLQAWWDVHAYYPRDASRGDQGGIVRLRLKIHPDGVIWMADVVESSGSRVVDMAGAAVFRGGFVRPLPPDRPEADLELTLHYVLAHRHDEAGHDKPVEPVTAQVVSKRPFTISNDPVKPTVVDTVLQRTCSGTVVADGLRNHPVYGSRHTTTAIFYRKPDGTPWVKFSEWGNVVAAPVTEVGKLVQWTGGPEPSSIHRGGIAETWFARYTVWPDGDNRLIGDIAFPRGTVDLTCSTETVPALAWNPMFETRGARDWQIDAVGR